MPKTITLFLTLSISLTLLSACAQNDPSTKDSVESTATTVKGEIYDSGVISVLVPDLWMAFESTLNGENDPSTIVVGKKFESESDLMNKPYVQIQYSENKGESQAKLDNAKALFDDAKDIEPIKSAGRTWNGFTYTTSNIPGFYFVTSDGKDEFVLSGLSENNNEIITFDDEEFLAILDSIKKINQE